MEEWLRTGLLWTLGLAVLVLCGPRLLRIAGAIVLGLGLAGILLAAPITDSLPAVAIGTLLYALGGLLLRRQRQHTGRPAAGRQTTSQRLLTATARRTR